MEKILIVFFLFLGVSLYSQPMTITQNTDPNLINDSGVACRVRAEDVDEDAGLFQGMYFDNYFARAYDLANDHGIDSDFAVQSVTLGQGFGRNIQVSINIYSANTAILSDPDLDLNLLQTEVIPIFEANTEEMLFVLIDAIIPAGEVLVVEVFAPNSQGATEEEFFMGTNTAGQTKPSYLKAPGAPGFGCSIEVYTDVTDQVGIQNYVMSVTGEETLSINQAELDKIEIFPNPVTDKVNLKLPAGLILEKSRIVNMNGKQFQANFINGAMDISDLPTGQYILNLETSAGNYRHKLLKK